MSQVKLSGHPHPLERRELSRYSFAWCHMCSERVEGECYYCSRCYEYFHEECAASLPEINHPSHPKHPLALLKCNALDYTDGECRLCGKNNSPMVYHCSVCGFSLDVLCARTPLEVVINQPKSHEHILTLMPRVISFICNACGEVGDRCPYVCPQCDIMVHKHCTHLPHVIKINRHPHRISCTYLLGRGDWVCGVCRREVDGKYGAYSCSICSYAVHSKCATITSVWNEKELEGEPEERDQVEEVKSFKMINDKVINHFSHEHDLRLDENGGSYGENKRCRACNLPVYFDPFYSCTQCDFILHQTCANLPRKRLHELFPQPLSLHANDSPHDKYFRGAFICSTCDRLCTGFKYKFGDIAIDVRCGSISEPFILEGHPHPLFFSFRDRRCKACGNNKQYVLNCTTCFFSLCCECATLPHTVRHKYDQHPLILRYGEEYVRGLYWCEICEEELDPKTRFYACDECGFISHVDCVLGEFLFFWTGHRFSFWDLEFEVIHNNRVSRPLCSRCKRRCQAPSIVKSTKFADTYICSPLCLYEFAA